MDPLSDESDLAVLLAIESDAVPVLQLHLILQRDEVDLELSDEVVG